MAAVQAVTWEEVLRAGRVVFGPRADALLSAAGWRDELKRAYRRRVLETHPDRARALGRPESELAREFQALADAYQFLQAAPEPARPSRARAPASPPASKAPPRPAQRAAARPPRPAARPSPRAAEAEAEALRARARREAEAARARRDAEARRVERARRAEQARRVVEELREQERWRAEAARKTAEARRGEQARKAEQARRAGGCDARDPRTSAGPRPRAAAAPDWRHVVKPRPFPRRRIRLAEFLYYSGRISWAELVEAVAWQRRQRPAVGRIAVDYGFLTPLEVIEVIERRHEAGAHDVPFGEFALRIGMITAFERLAMIGRQVRLQRPIGQFFVERGVIGEHEFADLRQQMVRHNLRHLL